MIYLSTAILTRYINSVTQQPHYDVCVNMVNAFSKLYMMDHNYSNCIIRIGIAMQNARLRMADNILYSAFKEEAI